MLDRPNRSNLRARFRGTVEYMTFDSRAEYAIAAAKRGDFDGAAIAVIDLVAEDWDNAEAHRAWGCLLLEQDKPTDAVAAFRTASTLDPRRPDVHFELATALLAEAKKNPFLPLTNWLEARDAVEEGLARSPYDQNGLDLRCQVEAQRSRALV